MKYQFAVCFMQLKHESIPFLENVVLSQVLLRAVIWLSFKVGLMACCDFDDKTILFNNKREQDNSPIFT